MQVKYPSVSSTYIIEDKPPDQKNPHSTGQFTDLMLPTYFLYTIWTKKN